MEKLKKYKYIILIILAVLGLAFYWYEYRPTIARTECGDSATQSVGRVYKYSASEGSAEELRLNQIFYQNCMRIRFGLEK